MKKVVIECSGASNTAKQISKIINSEYSKLEVKKFPDQELYVRFNKSLKGKKVILKFWYFCWIKMHNMIMNSTPKIHIRATMSDSFSWAQSYDSAYYFESACIFLYPSGTAPTFSNNIFEAKNGIEM